MSLKIFHIVFVVLSVITTLGFGIWALREYTRLNAPGALVMGIVSLVVSVALVIYGIKFLQKLKREGIS